MGGKGSGGRRIGAGRPRKSALEHFVTGDAGRRGRVLEHPSAVNAEPLPDLPVVDESQAPNDLSPDERNVWLRLAPHAMRAGTLVASTEYAFVLLCKEIVLERRYAQSVSEVGTAAHERAKMGVMRGLDAFGLRPQGKRMPEAETQKPMENPLSEFIRRA